MRAVLVVNPAATSTTRRVRDILLRALGSEVSIDVAETAGRGHAATIAAKARIDGVDLLISLGGDGTVNEIVNGLLGERLPGAQTVDADIRSEPRAATGAQVPLPLLAVVPGGSANVFGRALGYCADPITATSQLLDVLRAGQTRRVGLGCADGRYFTFSAGFGLDADVVHRVETHRRDGGEATPGLYLRMALAQFFRDADRRRPRLTLERAGCEPLHGIYFAIVSNANPWTYFGSRPVTVSPEASLETGLDLFAPRSMSTPTMLRYVAAALRRHGAPRGRGLVTAHDLPEFTLNATPAIAMQLDGEYVGDRRSVTLTSVPGALRVLAPEVT